MSGEGLPARLARALRVPEVEGAGPQAQEVDPSAETPHQASLTLSKRRL